jgi:hypothetical protein
VDEKGLKWYPPAGNGILAAVQGYYPRKGSVILGEVTTNIEEGIKVSGPDEGKPIAGVEAKANGDSKVESETPASEYS